MRALTYRSNPEGQHSVKPKAWSGPKAIKRIGPFISGRSLLRGYWYGKSAIGKWNRADQVLNGMRWNYYLSSGRGTPFFAKHNEHAPPESIHMTQAAEAQKTDTGRPAEKAARQTKNGHWERQHPHHQRAYAHHDPVGSAHARSGAADGISAAPAAAIPENIAPTLAPAEAHCRAAAAPVSADDAAANPGAGHIQDADALARIPPMRVGSPFPLPAPQPQAACEEPAQFQLMPTEAPGARPTNVKEQNTEPGTARTATANAPSNRPASHATGESAPQAEIRPASVLISAPNDSASIFLARLMEPDAIPRTDASAPAALPAQGMMPPRASPYIGSARRKAPQLKVASTDAAAPEG